uniref:Uncharacterized protein n=1 Tax=Oryza sativa subsp. japonica TaxID=39947 RepID=Q6ZAB0_ORYSJ|nr:hypothetical protein [Oryza sativa Japonica Group]
MHVLRASRSPEPSTPLASGVRARGRHYASMPPGACSRKESHLIHDARYVHPTRRRAGYQPRARVLWLADWLGARG